MPRNLLVLLIASLALVPAAPARGQSGEASAGRILVMPFDNPTREPKLHWIAEAASLLIADELNARGVPAIRRAERVNAFEQLQLPAAASLSRATVIKVGQVVQASEVIVGSVSLEGEDLVLEAHSVRIDVGRVQPAVSERGPLADVVELFERLSAKIASNAPLRGKPGPRPPLGAFEAYVKGLMAESAASRATFLEEAIRLHPEYDRAHIALWAVRHDQADHEAALAAITSVPDTSTLSRRARFFEAISLLELERYDDAFDAFESSADGTPPAFAAAALNNMGVVQLRRRAPSSKGEPTYFLTRAADADPGDSDILFNLGYAYVLERNPKGAIYWLREALRRDPGDAEAHYVLSAALQAAGSSVEATRERELARQLSSRLEELDRRAGTDEGMVAPGMERLREDPELRAGLRSEEMLLSSAQKEQQDVASFHLERGRRLYEREEDREAISELRRAVYLSPYEAQAHLLMGRIHLRGGRPAEAVEALKISIWSRETVEARIALADAYLRQQNVSGARGELEKALILDPESVEAKRMLAGLPVK